VIRLVAHLFDERNEGVKRMVKMAIATAKRTVAKSVYVVKLPATTLSLPSFGGTGIDSMSLNPDSVLKTL